VSAEENKAVASHINEGLWSDIAVTHATPRPSVTQKLVVWVAPGLDPRGFRTSVRDHRSDERRIVEERR
jgi:hypothetical protein